MEYLSLILCFAAGLLVYHIFFSKEGPGPFEKVIWAGLREGRRVVVSIDSEAYIFELENNRLRITQGITDFVEEESYARGMADVLDIVRDPKPTDPGSSDVPSSES